MRKQISHNDILHRQWWPSDFDPGGGSVGPPGEGKKTVMFVDKSSSSLTQDSSCQTPDPSREVGPVRGSPDMAADTAMVSPDLGVEDTSPTGTLDSTTSEDFKDSKYGSSSTMSVGSDVSPVQDRKQQRYRNQLSRMQVNWVGGPKRRCHTWYL